MKENMNYDKSWGSDWQPVDVQIYCCIINPNGDILYANKPFCELTGFTTGELIGNNVNAIGHDCPVNEFIKTMKQAMVLKGIWKGEFNLKTKSGSYIRLHSTVIPLLDDQGKTAQYLSICHSVDHTKEIGPQFNLRIEDMKEIIFQIEHKRKNFRIQYLGLVNLLDASRIPMGELTEIMQFF